MDVSGTKPQTIERVTTCSGQRSSGSVAERMSLAWAAQTDNTALIEGETVLTFGQLDRLTEQLSLHLISRGVQPGDRVAVCLQKGIAAVVSIHAVMRCGAAFVPIDPTLPAAVIQQTAELTQPSAVIISDSGDQLAWQLSLAASKAAIRVSLDPLGQVDSSTLGRQGSSGQSSLQQPSSPSRDSLAYVLFTSGSTGEPKGVAVTHDNVCTFLDAWDAVLGDGARTTWLALTTLSFDPMIVELMWALSSGATVVVPTGSAVTTSVGVLITQHGVTHMQCTPTRATILLADPRDREGLGRLQHLCVGGEVLSPALGRGLLETGLGRLTNVYGPTETTVWAFAGDVTLDDCNGAALSLGRPHCLLEADVVNELGQSIPAGEIGELIIGGPTVSSGYFARPDLTNAAYLDAGTETLHARRRYRTGDMMRVDNEGRYWFQGRRDGQLKIRGHRVEISAIEAALEANKSVQRAAVVVVGDEASHDLRLVAYVAVDDETFITEQMIVSVLRNVLPEWSIPDRVFTRPRLPSTATGKVDRSVLRREATTALEPQAADRVGATRKDLLGEVHKAVTMVLGKQIDDEADFFVNGGSSLTAVELAAVLFERVGIRMPLRIFGEAATPVQLANALFAHTVMPTIDTSHPEDVLVEFDVVTNPNAPTLFLIHGAGGAVFSFGELATALAPEIRLVGLQAVGLEGHHQPDRSVEDMSLRYAEAIRADASAGPVLVGGYSDGGVIATRVANLLRDEVTQPVLLLDSAVGMYVAKGFPDKLREVLRSWQSRTGLSPTAWAGGALRGWKGRHVDGARDDELAARIRELGYLDLFWVVSEACTAALQNPLPVALTAHLIRAEDFNPFERHDYDWVHRLGKEVSVTTSPGNHHTMFRGRNADPLAEAICRCYQSILKEKLLT
jgi:enterobactin synthetase component F